MSATAVDELARRLCCAWISCQLRVSYQHSLKTYMKDDPPGEYWYQLARGVMWDMLAGSESKA